MSKIGRPKMLAEHCDGVRAYKATLKQVSQDTGEVEFRADGKRIGRARWSGRHGLYDLTARLKPETELALTVKLHRLWMRWG